MTGPTIFYEEEATLASRPRKSTRERFFKPQLEIRYHRELNPKSEKC